MSGPGEFARKPGWEARTAARIRDRQAAYRSKRICCDALVWNDRNRSEVYLSLMVETRPQKPQQRRPERVTAMSVRLAALIVTDLSLRQPRSRKRPRPISRASSANFSPRSSPLSMPRRHSPRRTTLKWQHHIMRASDGSHYVAFSAEPATPLPPGPVLLYLRLATATPAGAQRIAERSPIKEWLAGSRTDPRLLPRSGIAIGEMPIMGPTGNMTTRPSTTHRIKRAPLDGEGTRTSAAGKRGARQAAPQRARRQGSVGAKHRAIRRLRCRIEINPQRWHAHHYARLHGRSRRL